MTPEDEMTTERENLLPCPFCGAEVSVGKSREGARIVYFQVECDCGAIAGSAYTTEEAAIKIGTAGKPPAPRAKRSLRNCGRMRRGIGS